MKDALIKTEAAAGGASRLARLVRHGVLACVLAGVGAGALAQNYDRGNPRREEAQPRDRFQMQMQDQRNFEERQRAYDEQRRQMQMEREQREQRGERRMTPDERSDLRRQINEARRDLYPHAQRR